MSSLTGHYEPSIPGARSLRETRPLWINGQHVTADVLNREVTVFLGTRVIFQGDLPASVIERSQVNPWIADFAMTYNAPKAIAQRAWDLHYAIACSDDPNVSRSDSPVYKASQGMLLASIRQAYGLSALMAVRVYDTLIESGEPVSWSVEYVRSAARRPRTSLHAANCDCVPAACDSPDVW